MKCETTHGILVLMNIYGIELYFVVLNKNNCTCFTFRFIRKECEKLNSISEVVTQKYAVYFYSKSSNNYFRQLHRIKHFSTNSGGVGICSRRRLSKVQL